MYEEIIKDKNLNKIAVVCIGYNRIKSLRRLLTSLDEAVYPSHDIPLVISIDCSGNNDLYQFVNEYSWTHGKKYVNIHKERQGLKSHIFQCADLSQFFKAVILLEDDVLVSPGFYSYTQQMVEKYSSDMNIAEISLYQNYINGYVGVPYSIEQNGLDVLLMQDVSTSGECFTKEMWQNFKVWLSSISEEDIQLVEMPHRIKTWKRAWSKYYNAYVVSTGKHVLYPLVSLTTNFGDDGEHTEYDSSPLVQVNLLQKGFNYRLDETPHLVAYDIFFNNEDIYKWLSLTAEQVCLDIFEMSRELNNRPFLLSTKVLPYKVIKSFALTMKPIELNIKYNLEGDGIFLYDTTVKKQVKGESKYPFKTIAYFLQGFNVRILSKYAIDYALKSIRRKVLKKLS